MIIISIKKNLSYFPDKTSFLVLIVLICIFLVSILLTKIPEQLYAIETLIIQLPRIIKSMDAKQL